MSALSCFMLWNLGLKEGKGTSSTLDYRVIIFLHLADCEKASIDIDLSLL